MKATTYGAIGIACALLIGACVMFEARIARVTSPDFAALAVDAGCTGGTEFLEAAIAGLSPAAAAIIAEGVETACTLRAERKTISATIYDTPLAAFCAQTDPLSAAEASPAIRSVFNARRGDICTGDTR